MDVKEFEKLQSKFKKKQAEVSEEKGKYKALLSNLKELGFDSVESGKKGMKKLEQDVQNIENKLNKAHKEFMDKYGEYL